MKVPTQRVKRKSDGEVCTINAGAYDRAIYEELDAPKAEKKVAPVPVVVKGKRRKGSE